MSLRFSTASTRYLEAGCPDRSGRPRGEAFVATQRAALARAGAFFGPRRLSDMSRATAAEYGALRAATPRAADIELAVVSNVLSYAVLRGELTVNPFMGRGRIQRASEVRHARDCMPRDAEELHRICGALSPVLAWQATMAALTGCRTAELLGLRMDAKEREPGWVSDRYLYVRRVKGGRFPYVELHPSLRVAIAAHRRWHAGVSPWWFPGRDGVSPLNRVALVHALDRLEGQKRTPHGLRAYYVTVCRSMGESDAQVAARIGDSTIGLIASVYGNLPEVWSGGAPLTWVPDGGPWWGEKEAENVVEFPVDSKAAVNA